MKSLFHRLAAGTCLSILCIWTSLAWAGEKIPQHVFIISMDGAKPSVIQQSQMPTLLAMTQEGAVTWKATTTAPPITLPSHTSMLTGVSPLIHKVLWNDYIPANGVVTVPTVFDLAHRAGLSTALFAAKEKFRHLNIPGSLDELSIVADEAPLVAQRAADYIKAKKPNLCFVHFMDPDNAGHFWGWGSGMQKQALKKVDGAITLLKDAVRDAGIASSSVFIITSDHGGTGFGHETPSVENSTIPWVVWGGRTRKGAMIDSPVNTFDTAATALWLLDVNIPKDWEGQPVKSAFEP